MGRRPQPYEKKYGVDLRTGGSQNGLGTSLPQMEAGLATLPTALRIPTGSAGDGEAASRSPGPRDDGGGGSGVCLLWVEISPELFSFTDGIFLECLRIPTNKSRRKTRIKKITIWQPPQQ